MSQHFAENKWLLEGFEKQENCTWMAININKENCYLKLLHSQLLIVDNGVVIQSMDFSCRREEIEVIYANFNIGIKVIDKNSRKTAKIRMRLADGSGNKTGSDYCNEAIEHIKRFVQVFKHPSHIERDQKQKMAQKILEDVKGVLAETSKRCDNDNFESIIPEDNFKHLIDEFVLHPQFPAKMVEVWEMLKNFK